MDAYSDTNGKMVYAHSVAILAQGISARIVFVAGPIASAAIVCGRLLFAALQRKRPRSLALIEGRDNNDLATDLCCTLLQGPLRRVTDLG